LLKKTVLVGRSSGCDIAVACSTVSARHCLLEFREGYWSVRDLASRNGTRVNGIRCQFHWLAPDDVLGIARQQFVIVYTPQSDQPPPPEDVFSVSLLDRAGLTSLKETEPEPPGGLGGRIRLDED
jgi:pSer/pThr/pTyr-binding forkhead associated (FHA) protein